MKKHLYRTDTGHQHSEAAPLEVDLAGQDVGTTYQLAVTISDPCTTGFLPAISISLPFLCLFPTFPTFIAACYATLHPALLVGRSVGRLVGQSVGTHFGQRPQRADVL